MPSSEKIGVIGLGLMGGVLAERLRAAGFAVAGYDIVPDKREYLARAGGEAAGSAREVAEKCGRLLFSLLTTNQAEAVLEEILPALQPGAVIIDTTTGSPERMAAIGERLEAQGAAYLDAPLAGSSAQAQRRGGWRC
ncbi:MAG: NAD(P)-binding domain-containing protein [Armatimonadetes bacterium]|nr:NAD(P)-binding domain-containing protein [Armatimonadota bacterium]